MPNPDRESLIASIVKNRPSVKRLIPRPIVVPREQAADLDIVLAHHDNSTEEQESEDGSPFVSKDLMRALKAPKENVPDDELLFTAGERAQIARDLAARRAGLAVRVTALESNP